MGGGLSFGNNLDMESSLYASCKGLSTRRNSCKVTDLYGSLRLEVVAPIENSASDSQKRIDQIDEFVAEFVFGKPVFIFLKMILSCPSFRESLINFLHAQRITMDKDNWSRIGDLDDDEDHVHDIIRDFLTAVKLSNERYRTFEPDELRNRYIQSSFFSKWKALEQGKYGHSMASSYDDNGQTRQYSSSLEYALSRSSSWLGYLIHVSAKFPLGIILIDANRDRQSYGRIDFPTSSILSMSDYFKKYHSDEEAENMSLASLLFLNHPDASNKFNEASLVMTTDATFFCSVDLQEGIRECQLGDEVFDHLHPTAFHYCRAPLGACVFMKAIRDQSNVVKYVIVMVEYYHRKDTAKRIMEFSARLFRLIPQDIVTL